VSRTQPDAPDGPGDGDGNLAKARLHPLAAYATSSSVRTE
jgi:hypothetical protein